MSVVVKYKTSATAQGGRDGQARTEDGTLDVRLVVPKALGGPGGEGVDPEKLFAAGYAACFLGALRFAAGQEKIEIPAETRVSADIGIGPRSGGGFGITAALTVDVPGLDHETLTDLIEKAHFVCPYSNAIRGNVIVPTLLA